jgi:hypothetical protein
MHLRRQRGTESRSAAAHVTTQAAGDAGRADGKIDHMRLDLAGYKRTRPSQNIYFHRSRKNAILAQ